MRVLRREILPLLFLASAILLGLLSNLLTERPAQAQLLSPGPLSEAHASLEGDNHCTDCHSSGKKLDIPKCLDCHKELKARIDAGKGLHARPDYQECGVCHIEHIGKSAHLVRWPGADPRDASKFDHILTGWALTGKHATTECAKCHDKKNERGAPTYLKLQETCTPCHTDPHKGSLGKECTKCHDTTDWKKASVSGAGGFDHSKTRFPLVGKHITVACKGCHGEPPKYRDIPFDSCSDCHKDPHQGKFKQACASCHVERSWKEIIKGKFVHPVLSLANGHAKLACEKCHDRGNDKDPSKGKTCVACHPAIHKAAFGTDCKKCHYEIVWQGIPQQVSLEAHEATAYPLQGKHLTVACAACHDPKKKPDPRFRQLTFARCADCHADKHTGEFASRAGGECAQCHVLSGFLPTTFGEKLHATTKLPLEGRHRAVPCSGCHSGPKPRLDWRNPKRGCAECHTNPHGDQFATEMASGGCAHCHNASSWNQVKVDHSTFPLLGAHARAGCNQCHDPKPEDLKAGKGASWKGVPRECEGCHTDAHGGQFRAAPAKGCPECHDNERFTIERFDHLGKTGYALDGKHNGLDCAKCHPVERRTDGVAAVRWRLGYRRCRDCHADPHGE